MKIIAISCIARSLPQLQGFMLSKSFTISSIKYSHRLLAYYIDQLYENVEVVERSKFISFIFPIKSAEDALLFINAYSDRKATHNCWAYRLSSGGYRFNDDGEPGGTAGRPILNALESDDMVDVVALVVRHYGGIKLGTGGLSRAYGDATKSVLQLARKIEYVQKIPAICYSPIGLVGKIYHVMNKYPTVEKVSEEISHSDGNYMEISLNIDMKNLENFQMTLQTVSNGKIKFCLLSSE